MREYPDEAPGIPGGFSRARLAELSVRPEEWGWWAVEHPDAEVEVTGGQQLPVGEGLLAILIAAAGLLALLAGLFPMVWLCAGYVSLWFLLRYRTPGSRRGRISELIAQPGQAYGGDRISRDAREAIELLLRIPGTCVFHDVPLPGAPDLRARHAVVNGGYVFLLDSSLTKPGVFRWGGVAGEVVVNVTAGTVHRGLRSTVVAFAARLRTPATYGAVMLMGAGASVEGGRAQEEVQLGSVHEVLGWVGDFLIEDALGLRGLDSARVRGVLYGSLGLSLT